MGWEGWRKRTRERKAKRKRVRECRMKNVREMKHTTLGEEGKGRKEGQKRRERRLLELKRGRQEAGKM